MAFNRGSDAVFKIDSTEGGSLVDISSYADSVEMNPEREDMELPRLGGNAVARLTGPVKHSFSLSGWWDPTLDEIFETHMNAATPVTRSIEYGPAGSTGGYRKYTAECYITSYTVSTEAEDPATWEADLVVDGTLTQTTW